MPDLHPSNRPELTDDEAWLDAIFTYHKATDDDMIGYSAIRNDARQLAKTILLHTPA
ncbi:unnamed protein product, partial [marine sediment metagenome]